MIFDEFDKKYLFLVLIFIIYLIVNTMIMGSKINEIDNYSRLLFLFPLFILLKNTSVSKIDIILICQICLVIAFSNFLLNHYPSNERYMGTSSSSITYGNIVMTIIIVLLYNTFNVKKTQIILLNILIITLGLVVWAETLTRGSLAGLTLALIYIAYINRNKIKLIFLSFIVIIFFISNSSISERIYSTYENIRSVSSFELMNSTIENRSENQRVAYILYALTQIQEKPFIGIGASNVSEPMRIYFRSNGYLVAQSDHFHNEYLDVITKFGLIGFILFFLIFFSIYQQIKKSKFIFFRDISMLLLLSQLGFMLFQSQFAHHQAITFFLIFLYYTLSQCTNSSDNRNY
tara:strand:+ start:377 stop:1417 length:1041 start_codon:yes stop_codon:yes gene_type:complete